MKSVVICVDDEKIILDSLRSLLKNAPELNIKLEIAESAEEALELAEYINEQNMDLAVAISDQLMPGMKGDEFLINLHKIFPKTMNIMLTGQAGIDAIANVVNNADLYRYITKPWESTDLIMTVKEALKKYNSDKIIEEQNRKIERLNLAMIEALENANNVNDECTGKHIKRVSEYAALIAHRSGQDEEFIRRIRSYASLHDIGKVGVSSEILNKPGKFTEEEFLKMQEHVILGSRILDSEEMDIMAKNIAQYHHEKWNGTGYASKLAGDQIPLEARIVAIADVFDALTTKRPYKDALSYEAAYDIIVKEKGYHFDPALIDTFVACFNEMMEIHKKNADCSK